MQPIFDLGDSFDTTLSIGDRVLPIHVKRFSRSEMEAFEKGWATYVVAPRGADAVALFRQQMAHAAKDDVVTLSSSAAAAILTRVDRAPEDPAGPELEERFQANTARFIEATIRVALTLDEGLVRDRGTWVTDGEGFIDVFHARHDVLVNAMVAIYLQNNLSGVIRKNSNSPRASEPGSEQSNPARGGDRQGPTAGSAASASTAVSAAATDGNDAMAEDGPESSGPTLTVQ